EAFDGITPRTSVLANFGVGYNHIDVPAAKAIGLTVTNTPGAVTDATADIAMTLILNLCRRAGEGERRVRKGSWSGWQPTQYLGFHVTGAHVGIIGMGRIGKAIAKRCHAGFDMTVSYFNRSEVADPGVPVTRIADLHELLRTVDIAVLAVPATPETRHLMSSEDLNALGPNGFLVNIARGDVVDEGALVAALRDGNIAGAGLDVYENEPRLAEGLAACENAVLLPHLGTAALPVREAMGMMALDNLDAALAGQTPPNTV
ncbi:MAG: D-glycerate dehydrogenase, partial [Pseudomonadota bacterium]